MRKRQVLLEIKTICRTFNYSTMSTFIDFSDRSVPYEVFLRDVAQSVVKMLSAQKDEPEFVSKRRAYELFGRGNVDRWLKNEEIEPHIRPGKTELRMADLRALQNKVQDYFK